MVNPYFLKRLNPNLIPSNRPKLLRTNDFAKDKKSLNEARFKFKIVSKFLFVEDNCRRTGTKL